MNWTDNPVRDAERYSNRMDEDFEDDEETRRPVCCECEQEITEDHYYVFDCMAYCPDCVDGHKIYL
jgi:hypothetical protein